MPQAKKSKPARSSSRTVKKKPQKKKRNYFQKSDWHVLVALATFIVAALLTRPEEATALEEAIFSFFYIETGFLIPIFFVLTQLGSVYFFATLSLLYLFLRNYIIVLRLLMAGALAYLLSGVGKDLFGRGRPDELFDNIVFHDVMVRGPGFPSGHTAMAVAIGIVLYNHTPKKWHIPIIIMTILAGISRMVLGVHTPLDIVGGAAIGWMSAMLFRHVTVRDRTP